MLWCIMPYYTMLSYILQYNLSLCSITHSGGASYHMTFDTRHMTYEWHGMARYDATRQAVQQWPLNWVALVVSRYLSNAASIVLCVIRRVKDHHKLLHDSPLLKNTFVRQVVPPELSRKKLMSVVAWCASRETSSPGHNSLISYHARQSAA